LALLATFSGISTFLDIDMKSTATIKCMSILASAACIAGAFFGFVTKLASNEIIVDPIDILFVLIGFATVVVGWWRQARLCGVACVICCLLDIQSNYLHYGAPPLWNRVDIAAMPFLLRLDYHYNTFGIILVTGIFMLALGSCSDRIKKRLITVACAFVLICSYIYVAHLSYITNRWPEGKHCSKNVASLAAVLTNSAAGEERSPALLIDKSREGGMGSEMSDTNLNSRFAQ